MDSNLPLPPAPPLPTREHVLSLLVIPQSIYDHCRRFAEEILFEYRYEIPEVFEILQEDSKVLNASEAEVNKMKTGLKSLLRYPLNLLVAPNRPELKIIKVSTSFFMFQVKRNLKDAHSFLSLMGYNQVRNATDLSLNKSFSIDRVYTLVLDIVILHEELEIISFLISQSMPNDVKLYHYFIARRYGPSDKWDCLDYIRKGEATRKALSLEQYPHPSSSYSITTTDWDHSTGQSYHNNDYRDERYDNTDYRYRHDDDRGASQGYYYHEDEQRRYHYPYGNESGQNQYRDDQYQYRDQYYQNHHDRDHRSQYQYEVSMKDDITPCPPPDPCSSSSLVPPDPHHQFTVGSMVCIDTQKGDPLYGVVKWIGTVPDYPGTIAGVEMEKPLRDGTDGTLHGTRFFTCPPGRGYFCPLDTLKQDTRYMDEGQVPAHLRQDIDNRSNKEEVIKLNEEILQLHKSIENLQLEKDTQQRTAKQEAEREKEQWKHEKQQLLEEQKCLEKVEERLETEKERIREENEHLRREITDLREAHHELQQETEKKEQVQAQLQSQVGLFSIENMRLKGQVKQLEESSATDIKYWEVSYKQVLTNKDTLGSGGWGKVEVGLLHGQKVAVKMLHSDIKSPYYNQLVRREISMLAKVRHPNLLLFIAGVLDHPSGSPIIITELLDTSLRKAYTDRLIGSDRVRISIMRDVAAALNYIHRQKESIIHRDVSSANVLLESRGERNWKAKLSDFGSANLVQFSTTVGPGAIPYAAPEVPHNQTTKMDVYSYGVLLCEVMLSEFPFKERFPDMLQSLAGSWSLMHQLILSCTRHSVTDRVDMMYILDTFNKHFTDVSVKGFVPLV